MHFNKNLIKILSALVLSSVLGALIYFFIFNGSDPETNLDDSLANDSGTEVSLQGADINGNDPETNLDDSLANDSGTEVSLQGAEDKKALTPSNSPYLMAISLAIALVISFIMILFLCFSLIKLYRWRIRIEGSENPILLPEIHYEKLESLESGVLSLADLINKFGGFLSNKEKDNQKSYQNIIDSFLKLQESIASKDDEISRLKKGYDNKIKKDFTSGLLSLRDRIEHYITAENSSEDLVKACNGMLTILDNTLMEEDILTFGYETGTSIREIEDFEILEKVPTSDEEKIGRAIKTIKQGYFLKGLDQNRIIIRKASIECYVEE